MIEGLTIFAAITAFGAGLVSFFAPCVIPLLPAYISYVTGVSLGQLQSGNVKQYRTRILGNSLLYLLGFSLLFVVLGAFAGSIGSLLRDFDRQIQFVGGIIILVFGLQFAGIIHIKWLDMKKGVAVPGWVQHMGVFRAFFLGMIFALVWTPCVSAVLGSILALATVGGDVVGGAVLLFIYSLGISIPFLIVSFALSSAPPYLRFAQKNLDTISYVSGVILAIIGLLLMTGTFPILNNIFGSLFQSVGLNYE